MPPAPGLEPRSANSRPLWQIAGDPAGLRLSDLPTGFRDCSRVLAKCMLVQAPHLPHNGPIPPWARAGARRLWPVLSHPLSRLHPVQGVPKTADARWLSPNSVLRPASTRQPSQARSVQTPLRFPASHPDRSRIPLPATDPSSLGLDRSAVGEPRAPELLLPPSAAPRPAHASRQQIPGRKQSPQSGGAALCLCVHIASLRPYSPDSPFSPPLLPLHPDLAAHPVTQQQVRSCASRLFPELESVQPRLPNFLSRTLSLQL